MPLFPRSKDDPSTVLVVEDETLVRLHVAEYLRTECGFRVYEAANADEALDILNAQPFVDLVFCDIALPGGVDGFTLTRRIRWERPKLPIILGSGHERAIAVASQLEEAAFFAKPYDMERLAGHMRRVIEDNRFS
jgi:DNA-binding NtrC family response regulator